MRDITSIISRDMEATLNDYMYEHERTLRLIRIGSPASHMEKWTKKVTRLEKQIPAFLASIERRKEWAGG